MPCCQSLDKLVSQLPLSVFRWLVRSALKPPHRMRGCLTVYSLLYVFKHIDSLAHQVHRRLPTTCADVTCLGCIAFAYYRECFPKAQTLVFEHLHKAIETPIIIHQAVADTSLVPLSGGLLFLFRNDHLPLGKIADDHSPFNQSVRDEMGGFVQPATCP